ncbi:hypothetical protein [Salibaculum griseiflavum]|uniref:Uncharacterized protein n=1 Tax=Salibaculum griseiflavum TaxID=1914409 RepID=A0A2V1NZQ7_9RHOB|nr:hypothetical protein [Salibaculum griseiflavum]PWG15576.1 hypothetical protein DFK10_16160 [Salibaculum griseiflavum]
MAPLAEDQAAPRANLFCDTSQAPEDLMPHISQPAQPQAGLSTPQSGTSAQPAAPLRGQGGFAGRVARAARGGLMAMLAGLLLVVTLVAMPGAAQAQTVAQTRPADQVVEPSPSISGNNNNAFCVGECPA